LNSEERALELNRPKQDTGQRETDAPSQLTSHRSWLKDRKLNSYKYHSCHLHEYF